MADNKDADDIDVQPGCLIGALLLAMPGMGDPRFEKAAIFICAHDAKGALGLIINQPLRGIEFDKLLEHMNITVGVPQISLPVMSGGPVENARGFILHSPEFAQPETIRINDSFSVTGTIETLQAIAAGQGPADRLFMLGYTGWSAGQLERELQDNAWLIVEAQPSLVFATAVDEKWGAAIRSLGFDPAMLSAEAGHA